MDLYTINKENTLVINGFKVRAIKGDSTLLPMVEYLFTKQADPRTEPELREILLSFVENEKPTGAILVNGNSVWNVSKLVRDAHKLVRDYRLENFTDYLYQFFSLQCGSIAHYNKAGWFSTYPTLDDLKRFFRNNEFGQPVKGYAPEWHYDARTAQEIISDLVLEGDEKYEGWRP